MSYYKDHGLEPPKAKGRGTLVAVINRPLRNVVGIEEFRRELAARPHIMERFEAAEAKVATVRADSTERR